MKVNSQYFSKEQIESKELNKLLDFLMSEAYGAGEYYNDIHVKPADCGAFIVEWVQIPWSHDFGGSFQYVDEDEQVLIERNFPDGHYDYFSNEEEFQEVLKSWLENNPGWVQTSWGTWTNEIENKKFQEEMEKQMKETSDLTGHDWVINEPEDDWDGK